MNVYWTDKAKVSFEKILTYLNENWSQREIDNFAEETKDIISRIRQNPFIYKASGKK